MFTWSGMHTIRLGQKFWTLLNLGMFSRAKGEVMSPPSVSPFFMSAIFFTLIIEAILHTAAIFFPIEGSHCLCTMPHHTHIASYNTIWLKFGGDGEIGNGACGFHEGTSAFPSIIQHCFIFMF